MIDTSHPELFYIDSPFLPLIDDSDIEEISRLQQTQKLNYLLALCHQSGKIGESLNLLHEAHLGWITKSFKCGSEDILFFYIGFTTPIQLILSAIQMDFATTKTVIQNLNLPTKYKLMQSHNQYKVNLLHDVYHIVSNKPQHKLGSVFKLILSLLRQKPFTKNKYYQAGIDAGVHTLITLFTTHQELYPPTSP